jgi:hypothetical protein
MQGLADELGVSRVTLLRRIGGREELLTGALWMLTERTLEAAAAQWEAERPEGELHTPGTGRNINAIVSQAKGLRRLLDDEPALTLRVLTDPRGRVQTGIVTFVETLSTRAEQPDPAARAAGSTGTALAGRTAGARWASHSPDAKALRPTGYSMGGASKSGGSWCGGTTRK